MTTPRYTLDIKELASGQAVIKVEEDSMIVEILDTIDELQAAGYSPWPSDKAPDPEHYDYAEVGHLLYGRMKTCWWQPLEGSDFRMWADCVDRSVLRWSGFKFCPYCGKPIFQKQHPRESAAPL